MDNVMGFSRGFFGKNKDKVNSVDSSAAEQQAAKEITTGVTSDVNEAGDITLLEAEVGQTYTIKKIDTADEEMNAFLFRLGCYSGEKITVVSKKKKSCVVVIKDGRYSLDELLASAIIV